MTGFAPGARVAAVITGMTLGTVTIAGLVTVDAGVLTA